MSHNLNYNSRTGKYSFASTQPAWHELGQVVKGVMTAEEAILQAGLDYTVKKIPNYAIDIDVDPDFRLLNPDSYSTVRTDTHTVLGTVGKVYTVVQNRDAFDFFSEFAGTKAAMFETAGALGLGETVFVSCKLPDCMVVGKKDNIDEYLLLVNSHDGKNKIKALFTPVRVVCNNTLNQAFKSYRMQVEIKHTTNAHERVKEAHKLMGIHKISMDNRSEIFNLLYNAPTTDVYARELIFNQFLTPDELKLVALNEGKFFNVDEISTKKKNVLVDVFAYLYDGIGQEEIQGTKWWILNGITGYYQNCKTYSTLDDKFESITKGTASTVTNNIFSNLVLSLT